MQSSGKASQQSFWFFPGSNHTLWRVVCWPPLSTTTGPTLSAFRRPKPFAVMVTADIAAVCMFLWMMSVMYKNDVWRAAIAICRRKPASSDQRNVHVSNSKQKMSTRIALTPERPSDRLCKSPNLKVISLVSRSHWSASVLSDMSAGESMMYCIATSCNSTSGVDGASWTTVSMLQRFQSLI